MRMAFPVLMLMFTAIPAPAADIVVQNGTDRVVTFQILHQDTPAEKVSLEPGECRAVAVGREPSIAAELEGKKIAYRLDPFHAYLFVQDGTKLGFTGIEFAAEMPKPDDVPMKPVASKLLTIPVKLLADSKDARAQQNWERVYRKRIEESSNLFEKSCKIRFTVDEVSDWGPKDADLTLPSFFREFAEVVKPKENQLALGYTLRLPPRKRDPQSTDKPPPETFGRSGFPWQSHLLMRDEIPATEPDRVEVLMHHLGWHLGAVTSPDEGSVMRSAVGDGKTADPRYRARLDPLNLLLITIWADEIRAGRGRTWKSLSPTAAARLLTIYKTLGKIQPDETAILDYVTALENLAAKDQ